jgi:ubiquinone/menaquinone biosynthesis C-methylase UbiE
MNIETAYNQWSESYDTVGNKTRDLEAKAIREMLNNEQEIDILELGCGTGKNTIWLQKQAKSLLCFDFSEDMMAIAKQNCQGSKVTFQQKDLNTAWELSPNSVDLITCSLVLEHIENLDHIFAEAAKILRKGCHFYIGEYHPFKQYQGKKARFETENGLYELECYTHNVSEFINAAKAHHFEIKDLQEYFDDEDKTLIPRILAMVFVLK